jgi:hypothetical protein
MYYDGVLDAQLMAIQMVNECVTNGYNAAIELSSYPFNCVKA